MGDISKNFSRWEFACKCDCGFSTADYQLIEVLEDVREHFDSGVTINSGCRCVSHNHNEGGSTRSKHLEGIAADFYVQGVDAERVYFYLVDKYPNSKGIGKYDGRTHVDVRVNKARWDKTGIKG
ncbi:D-Ala-D-Ala carboxypeptidase family metallohydrolase [bacterium]|nr:D-Ala-D-Ala carboxypeptidase family metallohydrolase [bacterium]